MDIRLFTYWSVSVAVVTVALAFGAGAVRADELPGGAEVLRNIESRPESPQRTEHLNIQLIEPDGSKRERTARVYRSRLQSEVRILFVFDSPPNIRDTALLIVDHDDPAVDDDRWIYLPALRKTRRIGAAERGQTFLGTDFTYEEIRNDARLQSADMTLEVIAAGETAGRPCINSRFQVISPTYANELGYNRIESCVDRESWIPVTMKMFAPDGKAVKDVELSALRQVGNVWVPMHREARTTEGHRTVIETTSLDLTTALPDDIFTEDGLKRGGR